MVQAGRPALCASSETAGHEAHHSKTQPTILLRPFNVFARDKLAIMVNKKVFLYKVNSLLRRTYATE